jgi:hypothetical protein
LKLKWTNNTLLMRYPLCRVGFADHAFCSSIVTTARLRWRCAELKGFAKNELLLKDYHYGIVSLQSQKFQDATKKFSGVEDAAHPFKIEV